MGKDIPEEIFFSVSPKLFTVSGEKTEKAIKPENVAEYCRMYQQRTVEVCGWSQVERMGRT